MMETIAEEPRPTTTKDVFESIQNCSWENVKAGVDLLAEQEVDLAIHEACKMKPPVSVIEILLEATPDAARTKDRLGYYPLHHACSSKASSQVVKTLIQAHPASVRARTDHSQKLPLHLVCEFGASEDVIMEILTFHPEGIYIRDLTGKVPMDYAKDLTDERTREGAVRALGRAPLFCAVSKAALQRVDYEYECRLRGITEANTSHLANAKAKYQDDVQKARRVADTLVAKLEEATAENQKLLELETRNQELQKELEEAKEQQSNVDLESMESSISDLESKVPMFQEKIAMLEEEKQQLKVDLDRERGRSKRLVFNKDRAEARTIELESFREDIQGMIDALRDKKMLIGEPEASGPPLARLKRDIERVIVKAVENHGVVESKDSEIENLQGRLLVHERAEQALATKAVQVENRYHQAAAERDVAEQERHHVSIEAADLKHALQISQRKVHTYEKRMQRLQRWINTLAFSTATWTVESDWMQSPADELLDAVAQSGGNSSTVQKMSSTIEDEGMSDTETATTSESTAHNKEEGSRSEFTGETSEV